MKKIIASFILTLVLVSCGSDSGTFRLEGRFRHLNQGEFYIYSLDGAISGIDTIRVSDSRFTYSLPMSGKATLMMLFPNFSEQPVFAEPGAKVKVKADASHLKAIEVEGTDDNKLMTDFRIRTSEMVPPDVVKDARKTIEDNPESPVALFLLSKYFVRRSRPDYAEAYRLVELICKAAPDNPYAARMKVQLERAKASAVGGRLPEFTATDTEGRSVGSASLKAELNVINVWATWSYDSQNIHRWLQIEKGRFGNRLGLLGICIDPTITKGRRMLANDSIGWPNVCDGMMWDSPLLKKLGVETVPANVVFDRNGTILARNLKGKEMREFIEKRLGK